MTTAMLVERKVESRQGNIRTMMIVFPILAACFVVLRFLARWKRGMRLGIDDWLLLIGMIFLWGLMACGLLMVHWGLGIHTADLEAEPLMHMGKTLVAFECIYVTSVAFVKVSLVVMFGRIFPLRQVQIGGWILGSVAVAWAISIVFTCVFQCTPVAKAWNPSLPGHCINLRGSFIGNAVPNILTDVFILALPIPQVWGLHTSVSQRLSLCVVFLLGSFVVFTSIYRFTTLFQFVQTDVSWTLATACAWTVVETSSGVISACLPTLGPLFQTIGLRLGISSTKSQSLPVDLITIGGGGAKRSRMHKSNSGTFGRLSEDVDFYDPRLRPDEGFQQSSKIERSKTAASSQGSGDETPLNQISKRVEVQWHESRGSD